MAVAADVVAFLTSLGSSQLESTGDPSVLSGEIRGVNTDQAAGPGEMAWLSAREVLRDPDRITNFVGSLLIVPMHTNGRPKAGAIVVRSLAPKLAFSRTVNRFFESLTLTEWPGPSEGLVHRTARIGDGVSLAPGVVIGSNVELGDDVSVGPNTCIANCIVASGVRIGANCSIGLPGFGYERDGDGQYWRFPHLGKVVIRENVEIGSNTAIDRGALGNTVIGRGVKIDNLVHIAHNVTLHDNVLVIANSMVAGSVTVASDAWIAPSSAIKNKLTIGRGAIVGLGAVVTRDVAPDAVVVGNPARPLQKD